MNKIKLASMFIVLIIAISGILTYNTMPIAVGQSSQDLKKAVAKNVYQKVYHQIEAVLTLAERFEISLPENLTTKVDLAKSLLENASRFIDSEPGRAMKFSIKASIVFGPVVRYVIHNIPDDAKKELKERSLKNAIYVNMKHLSKLTRVVQWLEDKGVPIPDKVLDVINEANSTLNDALASIDSGDYEVSEVAHLIGKAYNLMGQANVGLYKYTGRLWETVSYVDYTIKSLAHAVYRIGEAINKTIDIVNTGENIGEALNRTKAIANATNRLIDFIDKAYDKAVSKVGENKYTEALLRLEVVLNDIHPLLLQTVSYLEEGDLLNAINLLEASLNSLTEVIEEVYPIFREIHINLVKLREILPQAREHFKRAIGMMVINKISSLVIHLGKLSAGLKKSYALYQQGVISKSQFINILDMAENNLRSILDHLNNLPRPPHNLIQKVNSILNWIDQVRSELQG